MLTLNKDIIQRLIQIEASVHYSELPPTETDPFVIVDRGSPVVLSAPHGAITFRNNSQEIWHEEDEYTASMALLLCELCQTSAIATVWRTDTSDPNASPRNDSAYKTKLKALLDQGEARWLIDLHGAASQSRYLGENQWVDLGLGAKNQYLDADLADFLNSRVKHYLGVNATDRQGRPGFPAAEETRIAYFAFYECGIGSIQIEMKPNVRIPLRRVDASAYSKPITSGGGPYSAPDEQILGMMQALVDFIEYLEDL